MSLDRVFDTDQRDIFFQQFFNYITEKKREKIIIHENIIKFFLS